MRVRSCVMLLVATIAFEAAAAEPKASTADEPDSATVDAIVRKLESSGALDAAVERAIDRYVQQREQARQAADAKQRADLKGRVRNARPVDTKRDHIRGNASAEVSLIEYTDFECPFCKQFHATPKAVIERYAGRVNWVERHFPLPFHDPAARNEAIAAECAGQLGGNDVFWKYSDALFANTRSNGSGLPETQSFEKLAVATGVDAKALSQCIRDGKLAKRVEEDIADGTAAGIQATPTTVIRNNRTGASEAVAGALPADGLIAVIEQVLKAKP